MSLKTSLTKKRMGVPTWGWGLGVAALLYYFMKK